MVNMPANEAMTALYNHFIHKRNDKNNIIQTEEYEKESHTNASKQNKVSDINHNVYGSTNYCIGNCGGCTIDNSECPLSHPS